VTVTRWSRGGEWGRDVHDGFGVGISSIFKDRRLQYVAM